jgi:PAS domain S-box-containing protein
VNKLSPQVNSQQGEVGTREQAEEALRYSEERFRRLIEVCAESVWVTNARGEPKEDSPTWRAFTGRTLEQWLGTGWLEAVHPEDRQRVAQAWAHSVSTGEPYTIEFRQIHRSGENRLMCARAVPLRNPDGTIREWIGTTTDISERRWAEEALRTSEARLRAVFRSLAEGVVFLNTEGQVKETNDAVERVVGHSLAGPTDPLRDPRFRVVRSDGTPFPPQEQPAMVVLRTGKPVKNVEMGVYREDGTLRWISVNAQPVRNYLGELIGAVASLSDITERKQAVEALRENERRQRAILEQSPVGLVIVEAPSGRLVLGNRQGQRIFRHSVHRADTLADYAHWVGFHPGGEPYKREDWPISRALQAGEIVSDEEIEILRGDGTRGFITVNAGPIRAPDGKITGAVAIIQDITERKRAEREIRRSRAQLEAVFQAVGDGIVVSDMEGNFLLVNEAEARITGYPSREAMRRDLAYFQTVYELRGPDGQIVPAAEWPIAKVLAGQVVHSMELHARRTDTGQEWYYSFSGAPVYDSSGRQILAVTTTRDITERKRAEERLRLSEEQFRAMFTVTSVGMAQADAATMRFVRVNAAFCQVTGYSESELLGLTFSDITHPDDRRRDEEGLGRLLNGDAPMHSAERRYVRSDGSIVWVQVTVNLIRDPTGRPLRTLAVVQDITARKAAEAALRESEERFRAMANGAPVLIWIHRLDEGLAFVNEAFCEFFGVTLDQVRGSTWEPLVHPEDRDRYVNTFTESFYQRRKFHAQARVRRHDGQWRWIESFGAPWFSGGGEFFGMIGSTIDVTERKEFEAELERQVIERTRELRDINEHLNEFAYSIAHDLQAPLRAQLGYAQILEDEHNETLGEQGRMYLRRIGEAARRQGRLVSDLLKHTGIGRAELPLVPTSLKAVVQLAAADVAFESNQTQANLELGDLDFTVRANAGSLELVVQNLLTNALKFVPPYTRPRVRVWAEKLAPGKDQPGVIRLWVVDNGIGIAPEHQERIFGMFQRLHSEAAYPGTGIGLAIVKKAVERMGGSVGVESEPGSGSRFWVDLVPA